VTRWTPGPELPEPPEPTRLAADHRAALAEGRPEPDLVAGVAEAWWPALAPLLEPAGLDRQWLTDALGGYRRELWLWQAGERSWSQVAPGLLGWLARRLPT
jgi:hypothetical protein